MLNTVNIIIYMYRYLYTGHRFVDMCEQKKRLGYLLSIAIRLRDGFFFLDPGAGGFSLERRWFC